VGFVLRRVLVMSVESGFDDLQEKVDAGMAAVREARRRRDVFRTALGGLDEVKDVIPSGSLARGTHKDPIHDVDLLVVYEDDAHPDWHSSEENDDTAGEALEHTRKCVKELIGRNGTDGEEVRHTLLRNHSVKCFLDDPDDHDAFTVDVTPALRRAEGGLWIPESLSAKWVPSDPEHLMRIVADRHAEWPLFAKLVRILKRWNSDHGGLMKSLVVELLALDHLDGEDRPRALSKFFTSAAAAVQEPVYDPAELCGEVQPNLDRDAAEERLSEAAELAWEAVDLAGRGKGAQAMCKWRKIFGDIFPEPPGGCGSGAAAAAGAAAGKRPIRDLAQG
jgi:predicted nucleotidyltransferase